MQIITLNIIFKYERETKIFEIVFQETTFLFYGIHYGLYELLLVHPTLK